MQEPVSKKMKEFGLQILKAHFKTLFAFILHAVVVKSFFLTKERCMVRSEIQKIFMRSLK
jgi:hypothetical protein